jgi:hypothetical protein
VRISLAWFGMGLRVVARGAAICPRITVGPLDSRREWSVGRAQQEISAGIIERSFNKKFCMESTSAPVCPRAPGRTLSGRT